MKVTKRNLQTKQPQIREKILVTLHCELNDSKNNVTYVCIYKKLSINLYAFGSFTKQIYI